MGIRTRLTAWYVLVLCAGLIIFGAVLFFRSQQASSTALNQSLSDRASNLAQFVSVYPTVRLKAGAPDEAAGQLGAASVWLRVLDLHGNQVASQGPPLAGVPDNLLSTLIPGVHDTGSLRLLVFPLIRLGHLFGYVQAITTDS